MGSIKSSALVNSSTHVRLSLKVPVILTQVFPLEYLQLMAANSYLNPFSIHLTQDCKYTASMTDHSTQPPVHSAI